MCEWYCTYCNSSIITINNYLLRFVMFCYNNYIYIKNIIIIFIIIICKIESAFEVPILHLFITSVFSITTRSYDDRILWCAIKGIILFSFLFVDFYFICYEVYKRTGSNEENVQSLEVTLRERPVCLWQSLKESCPRYSTLYYLYCISLFSLINYYI